MAMGCLANALIAPIGVMDPLFRGRYNAIVVDAETAFSGGEKIRRTAVD